VNPIAINPIPAALAPLAAIAGKPPGDLLAIAPKFLGSAARQFFTTAALIGGLVAQALIVILFFVSELGFLWFNVIACVTVMVVSLVAQTVVRR
jgi:hypothetical protein